MRLLPYSPFEAGLTSNSHTYYFPYLKTRMIFSRGFKRALTLKIVGNKQMERKKAFGV